MPEFEDQRDRLQQARTQKEQARLDLFQSKEQMKKIQAEQTRLDQVFNPNNPEHVSRRQQLDRLSASADAAIQRQEAADRNARQAEVNAFNAFKPLLDPRKQVNRLSDRYPFLLLPVRLETRFKTITAPTGAISQELWVRVYPDDCAIDTFEPFLSESELKSLSTYWIEMWKAGGIENQERGAWRGLVSSHGSGRAAWMLQQTYQPLNSKPTKTLETDVILTIAPETLPSETEQTALQNYWRTIWLADSDRDQTEAAFDTLVGAISNDSTRAATLIQQYIPVNLKERPKLPLTKTDVTVNVAFLHLPDVQTIFTKQQSWSQAPRVNILPDCFVLIAEDGGNTLEFIGELIPSPLVVGPDLSAAPTEQLRQENGNLVISEDMRWMVDFERAVAVGMGFKIPLDLAQARRGFDRILVLGLRLSANEQESKTILETLIQHHHNGRSGFSLLPQGTPTNNTDRAGSGFSRADDADDSFNDYFRNATQGTDADSLFAEVDDPLQKRDGQWLAELLGIDPSLLKKVRHSDGTDQCEARAMNTALWPATLGYWMETMMHPVFTDTAIEDTRTFFTQFVTGRGAIPAIRIGSQPYGILPTTAFSRIRWMFPPETPGVAAIVRPSLSSGFLVRLYEILQLVDEDWTDLSRNVSFVGKSGDAHKILLDVLGLHAGSVEYYQRYAESLQHLFNRLNLGGLGGNLLAALIAISYTATGMDLLRQLGYANETVPDILEKFFLGSQNLLQGVVVDDRPLSETEPIRGYTPPTTEAPNSVNYLQWLIDAAVTSLNTLRQQQGFTDNKEPTALLYLLLRHALILGYWDASLRLHQSAEILSPIELTALRREANFVHVRQQATTSESRWQYLYKNESRITGSNDLAIADYIPRVIGELIATRHLDDQIKALEHLKNTPTARLERVFAEHIDCCSYRLDAWQLGLVNYQLQAMRGLLSAKAEDSKPVQGLYLGAFGWLENVRPENKPLSPQPLDDELAKIFNQSPAYSPIMQDASNGGYIHAPSLNQAVTAAVLRNGYLSNATPANPQTLAVNLSSQRIRLALGILEGIRNGQSLSALLGYQLERGLHDRYALAEAGIEVDQFIYELRKGFPLRANRFITTEELTEPIQSLEARNVVDGLSLINHIKQTSNKTYPFGKSLERGNPTQEAAINAEVDRLLDIHDAVADLALAESVHQAVQGNYDRAAATLDTYSKGNFPPDPDVVQTPRSGITLTHRVGLHLRAGLAPDPTATPRAQSEPALNQWLTSVLPPTDQVACKVTYHNPITGEPVLDPVTAAPIAQTVTQQQLQLQPIDWLYVLRTDSQPAMTELDDRILLYVTQTFSPRPDTLLKIHYTERLTGKISFFELAPMMQSLRSLILRSRPLKASDIALHNEANQAQEEKVFVDPGRVTLMQTSLSTWQTINLPPFKTTLTTLLADTVANRTQILTDIDANIATAINLLSTASRYGIPQTGWGFAMEWKQRTFGESLKKVRELVDRWDDRLTQFSLRLTDYSALPPTTADQERYDLLQQAERLVSTTVTTPLPATPADLQTAILTKRDNFLTKLNAFKAILATPTTAIATLHDNIVFLLPIADFDVLAFTLTDQEDETVRFTGELFNLITNLDVEIGRRLTQLQDYLNIHNTSTQSTVRVQALQDAAKALLGDEFQLIPEFELTADQGNAWENSFNDSESGSLTNYLTGTVGIDFPVDNWLYGAARVREKLHHWEHLVMLTGAFERPEPELQPIQLPYKTNDHWLALQFPYNPDPATKTDPTQNYQFDGDRLLYTAHYAAPFQKNQRQCGLLLDEWTEVIPSDTETTGITFNYDRPNCEPPQTMLLVTPPDFTGSWQWQDLVAALNETLDMTKKRAVEPDQVDATPYAQFLPATITAVTLYQISISANLALNNKVLDILTEEDA